MHVNVEAKPVDSNFHAFSDRIYTSNSIKYNIDGAKKKLSRKVLWKEQGKRCNEWIILRIVRNYFLKFKGTLLPYENFPRAIERKEVSKKIEILSLPGFRPFDTFSHILHVVNFHEQLTIQFLKCKNIL